MFLPHGALPGEGSSSHLQSSEAHLCSLPLYVLALLCLSPGCNPPPFSCMSSPCIYPIWFRCGHLKFGFILHLPSAQLYGFMLFLSESFCFEYPPL